MIEGLPCGGHGKSAGWRHAVILAIAMALLSPTPVFAQADGCVLVPDDRRVAEKILRCGDDLKIRVAPGSRYELTGQEEKSPPGGVRLESGALIIEFNPRGERRSFQILTPHAIAAVRGTRWAVEVGSGRTSTLVLDGAVEVRRPTSTQAVTLQSGDGADVSPGSGPIQVKRWPRKRVRALLARFGH